MASRTCCPSIAAAAAVAAFCGCALPTFVPERTGTAAEHAPPPPPGEHWVADPSFDPSFRLLHPACRRGRHGRLWRWGGSAAPRGAVGEAIAASRHDGGLAERDVVLLQHAASDPSLTDRTRAAAVEAVSLELERRDTGERGFRPLGELLEDAPPETVRCEIVRSLGRGVSPARVPLVCEVFASPGSFTEPLRVAALDCCLLAAGRGVGEDGMPPTAGGFRRDGSSRVRVRYGRLLAATAAADAEETLLASRRDAAPEVRHEALTSLGLLGGDAAEGHLRSALSSESSRARSAAVRSLAAVGVPGEGWDDRDADVREAAADSFRGGPSPRAVEMLRRLAGDRDRRVQSAAADAPAGWPDGAALRVYAAVLESSGRDARVIAVRDLRRRGVATSPVDADAPAAELREVASRLRAAAAGSRESPPEKEDAPRLNLAWAVHASAAGSTSRDVEAALRLISAADLPEVERIVAGLSGGAEALWEGPFWRRHLPRLRADLRAVGMLRSHDPARRGEGAELLAEHCGRAAVSPLAAERLGGLVAAEQNARVWRGLVRAAQEDPAVAGAVVPAAVNGPWPDVRAAGCRAIGPHTPRLASYLRPLLSDGSAAVRIEACRAAARCGNPALLNDAASGPGLLALRTDPAAEVRTEAVAAAARLGDEAAAVCLLEKVASGPVSERRVCARSLADAAHAEPVRRRAPAAGRLAERETDPATRADLHRLLNAVRGRGAGQGGGQTPPASGKPRMSPRKK